MRKYEKIKTIQLIVFFAITVVGLVFIFTNKEIYQLIAQNHTLKFFFGILWLILALSFLFLFVDFNSFNRMKADLSELDMAVFSDPTTGMANRYSCDALIEQYLDKDLPKDIGCITFDIINLSEINKTYGHMAGNEAIKGFSNILQSAAVNKCFVGRNGGNKFLAIFQECSQEKMDKFIEEVDLKMSKLNEISDSGKIDYKYGRAFEEGQEVTRINQLIALSNRRAIESYRVFVDR